MMSGVLMVDVLNYRNDRGINSAQGIVDDTIEGTADNVGRLNAEGMRDVDRVLINIIEERVRRSEMM